MQNSGVYLPIAFLPIILEDGRRRWGKGCYIELLHSPIFHQHAKILTPLIIMGENAGKEEGQRGVIGWKRMRVNGERSNIKGWIEM